MLQLVLPSVLVSQELKQLHDSATAGHLGVQKTLGKIRRRFYGWDSARMWRTGVVAVRHVQQGNHQCLVVMLLCCHQPVGHLFNVLQWTLLVLFHEGYGTCISC